MDLREFLTAITADWVTLMSGIASVVLLILGTVRDWGKIPRWAFWTAAALCFFFASARVWTTEHRTRIQEESNNRELGKQIADRLPNLEGEIEQTITAKGSHGTGMAFVQVEIRNTGGSPTIAEKYLISVKLKDGRIFKGIPFTVTGGMEGMKFGDKKPFKELLAIGILIDKTSHPIPSGGNARGWIPLEFPGTKHGDELTIPGSEWNVSFTDIHGKRYTVTNLWTGHETKGLQYYPPTQ